MAFKPGHAPSKPKGCADKHYRITDIQRKQMAAQLGGITPLEYACSILRDDEETMTNKKWACELLMPYMHRKLPVAVEMSGGTVTTVVSAESLANLSMSELEKLMQAVLKITQTSET